MLFEMTLKDLSEKVSLLSDCMKWIEKDRSAGSALETQVLRDVETALEQLSVISAHLYTLHDIVCDDMGYQGEFYRIERGSNDF